MDGDGSSSGADRTLWTVWSYITDAVNRFIRTLSTNISDNTDSLEETPVDSERVDDSAPTEGDAGGRVGAEEPPPAAAPLLSSSRPLVAWEFCTTEIDLGAEENDQNEVQPSGGHRRKASEKSEGAGGDREDGGRPIADGDEREENGERRDGEEHANTRWLKLTADAMSDDVEESEGEAGAAGETKRAVTPEDPREMDETTRKIQGKEHEGEKDLQNEDIEVKICPITDLSVEEEDEVHEAESTVTHEEVEDGDGVPAMASVVSDAGFTSPHVELQTAHHNRAVESESSESDGVEKANEEKAGAVSEEENAKEDSNHGTMEREDAVKTLTGGSERGDVLTEDVPRGEEVARNAEAEPRDAGRVDAARSADAQTKTRQVGGDGTESVAVKSDGTTAESSAGEELFDKDRVEEEEERPFGEEGSKESFMEMSGSLNSEEPEGETVQETAAAIKDIPTGMFEGRLVVSELNFPTCEETQMGVPEYNNVPDENTTQVFLEEGDCEGSVLPEEVGSKEPEGLQNSGRATQVFLEEGDCEGSVRPEEVGSKEPESFQNSGCATGAGYLVAAEDMEEEQDIMRDLEQSFDAGLPHETEKPLEAVTRESEQLFEEEEGEFLVDCMKTGIDHSEKEFETHVGPTDEINNAANEPPDGLEEILVDFQIDEGSCDPKAADAAEDGCGTTGASATQETFLQEEQTMTETSSCQVGELTSEQNRNMAPSSLEDITEHEFLKRHDETEDELLEDVKMQEARADVEETGGEVEQVVAEDEMESQNEMGVSHLQVEDLAEFEGSPLVVSPEKRHLQPDEALEFGDETSTDSEAPDESKTAECRAEDFTSKPGAEEESGAEGTVCSSGGRQGVIDDDVLDLWLQAASPENDDGVQRQVDPRTGQLMEPYDEEQGDISSLQTEKDVDQLAESNSRESDLEGHTETSSSTVETGCRGLYDTLAIVSESGDVSELSAQQPNCDWRDMLGEEATETGKTYLEEKEASAKTGFHPDSGVPSPEARHLNQGSAEASDRKDGGEDEAQSQTERSCLYQFEKTQTEDGPPEMAASGSPGEGSEPARPSSGSEASLEDETVPKESRSQSDVCSESEMKLSSVDKPQPGWNEGVAESSVGLNATDGAGHPTTTSEDQMEVESSALDFTAQRSRISVKNPRVRPPKDSRSLLNMPSLDPTPSQQMSAKAPVGGPLGGLGFGVKLPGLGGGFPVLKKTKRVVRDENSPETISEETKPEERSDSEGDTQHKPKWMPPRHPGFGNPLMSELKTKLKKTTKE
ncbi:uncharacterized protein ACO6RY_16360 [Pungitius sinensis]